MAALPPAVLHVLFAAALVTAVYIGRGTQLETSGYALAWPAAGAGFLWVLWAWPRRVGLAVALSGVFLLTALLNALTGLDPDVAVITGIGNPVQALAAVFLFTRFVPGRTQQSVGEYMWLAAAAVVATGVGGAVIAAGAYATGAGNVVQGFLPWVVRNTVSLVAIGSVALVATRTVPGPSPARHSTRRWIEYAALAGATALLYLVSFVPSNPLPIAFITLPANIWAGLRLTTGWAMAHGLASGTLLVWLTISGHGPFTGLPPDTAAYLAQAFTFVAFSVSAVLALNGEERLRLIASLSEAHREAQGATQLRDVVIEKMYDGVIAVDAAGSVLVHNTAGARWVGESGLRSDVPWTARYDFRTTAGVPLTEEELPLNRALAGETVERESVDLHLPEGEVRHLSVDAVPLPAGQGAVIVFHNVTVERRHQQDLARFAAVVAHDLLTPLTVFDGWLEILEEEELTEEERASVVRRLSRASLRMSSQIRALLDYSLAKADKLTPGPVDVNAVVSAIVDLRAALPAEADAPPVDFRLDLRSDVYADKRLFTQLMENLIGNAVKYGPADGTAVVAVTSEKDPETGWTRIRVADNGIGVPAGDRERIFTEFHRSANGASRAPGTGLGLAICRRIVESHGGDIRVESPPTGGAVFVATLPATSEQLPAGIGAEAAGSRVSAGGAS
ncbi:ATP-binding protein [Arthrobacter crusticola]|nr:ATP-binding protein [Arthrobacter crusticola]